MLLLERQQENNITAAIFRHTELTSRETEVLSWIAKGKSNQDIAEILRLSFRTVKNISNIYLINSEWETAQRQYCALMIFFNVQQDSTELSVKSAFMYFFQALGYFSIFTAYFFMHFARYVKILYCK